jgi:hypothetical protein
VTRQPDYPTLAVTAEKAVQGIKDPALKRLAFEKVLEDMLHTNSVDTGNKRKPKAIQPAPSKAVASTAGTRSGGPQFLVEELEGDGFFKNPKTIAQVRTELKNRGHHLPVTSLSGPLQILCQRKVLRREKIANGKKQRSFAYSEW